MSASSFPDLALVRERLLCDGFCPVGPVVPSATLAHAHLTGAALLAAEPAESLRALRSLGSLISVLHHPEFAPLIGDPSLTGLLSGLGPDLRFSAGYFISKPAGSPATFWHQDWGFWQYPASYEPRLLEVGVLIYLVDVDELNGCPRFLPGSHLRRHPLHDALASADVRALRRADEPDARAYLALGEAVSTPVPAGHAVLFDPRVLHGAWANQSEASRPALVLWYFTDYQALDPAIRTFLADGDPSLAWPRSARERVAALMPTPGPSGVKAHLQKHPDERLR